jgi:hypothetical protein
MTARGYQRCRWTLGRCFGTASRQFGVLLLSDLPLGRGAAPNINGLVGRRDRIGGSAAATCSRVPPDSPNGGGPPFDPPAGSAIVPGRPAVGLPGPSSFSARGSLAASRPRVEVGRPGPDRTAAVGPPKCDRGRAGPPAPPPGRGPGGLVGRSRTGRVQGERRQGRDGRAFAVAILGQRPRSRTSGRPWARSGPAGARRRRGGRGTRPRCARGRRP